MRVYADDPHFQYEGRIDFSDRRKPVFVFPCTSVAFRFTSARLKIYVENRRAYWDNFLGIMLDGKESKIALPADGISCFEVEVNPEIHEHTCLLWKRQDACHELIFEGLEIDDEGSMLACAPKPKRAMEFYGDSVTAGEVSEAVQCIGQPDPDHQGEYSNSFYSYAWLTARKLHARIHDIAQGGIALLHGTGWYYEPNAIGMEDVWDKVHYNPTFGEATTWDFDAYTPQVVVVALGQNDSHPDDYMKEDPDGEKALNWKEHYYLFLQGLRKVYPKAWIVCCTTLLMHDASWDMAIDEVVTKAKDDKIAHCMFRRNGAGTPGHLRIPEAEEMAEELVRLIDTLPIEDWN